MGVEIIVSDGGSIDGTCELAAPYAEKSSVERKDGLVR
jgi:glycosyltransferase involved in cell wall biosynthesis